MSPPRVGEPATAVAELDATVSPREERENTGGAGEGAGSGPGAPGIAATCPGGRGSTDFLRFPADPETSGTQHRVTCTPRSKLLPHGALRTGRTRTPSVSS
ncbi:hypothetical protein [Brachybacterium sacelli]|uniref:hypothetical protein n=1 Tax=Brachybacterium sacelli TaxID=173364 RepID=UPI00361E76F1